MQLCFEGGAGYRTKNLDFRDGFGCVLLVGEARVLLMGEDSFGSVFVCKGEDKFRALDSRTIVYGLGAVHINRNLHETGAHPKTHNMVPEANTPRTHPCSHDSSQPRSQRPTPQLGSWDPASLMGPSERCKVQSSDSNSTRTKCPPGGRVQAV